MFPPQKAGRLSNFLFSIISSMDSAANAAPNLFWHSQHCVTLSFSLSLSLSVCLSILTAGLTVILCQTLQPQTVLKGQAFVQLLTFSLPLSEMLLDAYKLAKWGPWLIG